MERGVGRKWELVFEARERGEENGQWVCWAESMAVRCVRPELLLAVSDPWFTAMLPPKSNGDAADVSGN